MPQIIVTADTTDDARKRPVMLAERVSVSDFESRHFQTQLVQRLGWAVGDADVVEQYGQLPHDAEAADEQAQTSQTDALQPAGDPRDEYAGRTSDAQPVS